MRRLWLLLLLTPLVPVLVAPSPAFACSCVPLSARQHVNNADLVVAGELTAMEPPAAGRDGVLSDRDPTTYEVLVTEVYKGEAGGAVSFTSDSSSASCGLEGMKVGREYMFFLDEGRRGHSANLCNGTGRVFEQQVAAITGAPQVPAVESTVIDEDLPAQSAIPLLPLAAAGGVLAAILGGLWVTMRRRGGVSPFQTATSGEDSAH